jgi:hypothetical protein
LSSICISDETSRSPHRAEGLSAEATEEKPKFSRLWWYIDSRENIAIEYPWFTFPHHGNAADICVAALSTIGGRENTRQFAIHTVAAQANRKFLASCCRNFLTRSAPRSMTAPMASSTF